MTNQQIEPSLQSDSSRIFTDWSDKKLLSTAIKYGEEARSWRNKFLGLLPEIDRRRLYEQRGFVSIFHFAKVLGGISEEQVRLALNLERRFENKPALREVLVRGEVSIHKLTRIASIATAENAEELAQTAKSLPREALETYVRDARVNQKQETLGSEVLHVQSSTPPIEITYQLAPEVQKKLEELHLKGIDINKVILKALNEREEKIQDEKEFIAETCSETESRYISARTRKHLNQEHGTKCSIKTCSRPSKEIHHTQRFSVAKTHDPHYLAPLCSGHHTLAHMVDLKYRSYKNRSTR